MGSIKYKWKELDDKSSSSCALDRNYLSRLLKVDGQFDSCFAAKIFHFWYLQTDENLIARLTARACDELGLTAGGKSFSVGKLSAVYKAPHISHVCHLSRLLYLQYADSGWKNNRARFHNLCKKKKKKIAYIWLVNSCGIGRVVIHSSRYWEARGKKAKHNNLDRAASEVAPRPPRHRSKNRPREVKRKKSGTRWSAWRQQLQFVLSVNGDVSASFTTGRKLC